MSAEVNQSWSEETSLSAIVRSSPLVISFNCGHTMIVIIAFRHSSTNQRSWEGEVHAPRGRGVPPAWINRTVATIFRIWSWFMTHHSSNSEKEEQTPLSFCQLFSWAHFLHANRFQPSMSVIIVIILNGCYH